MAEYIASSAVTLHSHRHYKGKSIPTGLWLQIRCYLGHVEKRLKAAGIFRSVQDKQFQAYQWRCGHFDQLPLELYRFAGKLVYFFISGFD
jgi:hypothetical protein